jgi:putative holin
MKGGEHMDIGTMGITSVAAITVICYLVGNAVKATDVDNKWIPIIVGTVGGVLGVAGMYIMPDFPATDYLTAIAVGIVSGLAAVGVNQIGKQLHQ